MHGLRRLWFLGCMALVALLVVGAACGGGGAPAAAPKAPAAPAAAPKPATAPAQQPAAPAAQPKPAAPPGGAKFNALVEAARAEAQQNSTMYIRYTGLKDETLAATEKAFKEQFGITVKLINEGKGYAATQAAYLAETQAGKKNLPPLGYVAQSLAYSMWETKALVDVDWKGLFDEKWPVVSQLTQQSLIPEVRSACVPMAWRLYVIGYNTKAIKPQEAPRKWADLLDPKYKGRLGAGGDGSAIATSYLGAGPWGEERALDYARKYHANKPIIFEGGSPAVAGALTTGEVIVGGLGNYQAFQQKVKGAPVDYVIPEDGALYTPDVLCVVKEASHPNLARLLVAYWASLTDENPVVDSEGWSFIYPFFQRGHLAAKLKEQKLDFSVLHDFSAPDESRREVVFRKVIGQTLGTLK